MRKLSDHVIYRDPRFFCAFPAAGLLADEELLVVFRRARDPRYLFSAGEAPDEAWFDSVDHLDSRSLLTALRLGPDLRLREGPVDLSVDPEAADQDPSLLRLRDGRLLLAGFSWYPYRASYDPAFDAEADATERHVSNVPLRFRFWGGYTRLSDDGGRSWRSHANLPPLPGLPDIIPGKRPLYGGAVRGRPLELPDGTVLLATYGRHPKAKGQNASFLLRSKDRGETWHYGGIIAMDPAGEAGFAEPSLYAAPSGEIIAFHRTMGLDDRLATARSADGGASWAPWQLSNLWGHPFDAVTLPGGGALLVYGYRHPPFGIRARRCDGEFRDLERSEELVIRDDSPSGDVGYPWAVSLPDGQVAVVYYFCDQVGIRHIAASLLAD